MVTGSVQIKDGKYYAVLNLKNENGKRKQKWISTGLLIRGNKKKAEKFLSEKIAEYDKKNVKYSDLTVAEYFENWLSEIKSEVKPNTYRNYHANMVNHIIPYFKNKGILLQDLKPQHLEDYYNSKLQSNSKLNSAEALSRTTIKHHHQNISKALSDAVRKEVIYYNPATSARTPKAEKFKAEFLNQSQVNEMLVLFKDSVIYIPILLASVYGLRRSEVLGLQWKNIDFVNKSIHIVQTLQQNTGGSYLDTTKTESSNRTLPMTNDIYNVLNKHKAEQESRQNLMGNYYIASDFVCTWNNGKVISPNYLTKTFHSIISKSSLPDIRFHDLRHSAASNLLEMGFSVVQVADWLGHSSSTTTLNFYAHVDKKSKLNIANALEKVIDF